MKTEYNIPTSVRHLTVNDEDENVRRTLTTKVCSTCNLRKPLDKYYKRTNGDPVASCKSCQLKEKKKYYKKNEKVLKQKRKQYYDENKPKIRKAESEYRKKRRKSDPAFQLTLSIRNHTYQFLKSNKTNSTVKYLGCSSEDLKSYLEKQFKPNMTWENYGKWHIDHIFPLSKVDLNNKEECEKALHYTNLQPLWAIDNIKKGNKIL